MSESRRRTGAPGVTRTTATLSIAIVVAVLSSTAAVEVVFGPGFELHTHIKGMMTAVGAPAAAAVPHRNQIKVGLYDLSNTLNLEKGHAGRKRFFSGNNPQYGILEVGVQLSHLLAPFFTVV